VISSAQPPKNGMKANGHGSRMCKTAIPAHPQNIQQSLGGKTTTPGHDPQIPEIKQ
jgi:hypothetical protein